ncbi:MAG: hypothetical protein H6R00_2045 [Proteobacteria bacterium]|nr:hypothetical protein [Pseudomonadota bacterium]
MRVILAALLASGTLVFASAVPAQTPSTQTPPTQSPSADNGFSLQPAVGDYLKIDRRTGDVSHCAARDGAWSCQLIAEDRKAYEERIAELEAENERLNKRLAALEAQTKGERAPLLDKDDERRVQEFFDLSDRMFRHFFDLVERLRQRDEGPI